MTLSEYFSKSKAWKREYWNNRECIYIEGTPIVVTEHMNRYYLSTNDKFPCYDNEIKTVETLIKRINIFLSKEEKSVSNNLNTLQNLKNKIKEGYDSKN